MLPRALLAVLMTALIAWAGPSGAATQGAVIVPPTRSACGAVHLPSSTTLGIAQALASARRGWRVVYVVQAKGREPINAVGIRAEGVGVHAGAGTISVLGYQQDSEFPAGDYRVCVFSDHPASISIPAPRLRSRLPVALHPVRARGGYPALQDSSSPLVVDQSRLTTLRTRPTSLVVIGGSYRFDTGSPLRSSGGTICYVPQGRACHDDPLFGLDDPSTSAGKSADAEFTYYATIDMTAGDFSAGYRFRGTQAPTALASFVLQADL